MLSLTRKLDQSIIINGNIRVKILQNDGHSVRLGIDAPKDVVVDREEIHLRKQAESNGNGS